MFGKNLSKPKEPLHKKANPQVLIYSLGLIFLFFLTFVINQHIEELEAKNDFERTLKQLRPNIIFISRIVIIYLMLFLHDINPSFLISTFSVLLGSLLLINQTFFASIFSGFVISQMYEKGDKIRMVDQKIEGTIKYMDLLNCKLDNGYVIPNTDLLQKTLQKL